MEVLPFQHAFMHLLKANVPVHTALANELADLLAVSVDSAYRRLRCETAITLDETMRICKHYGLSMDMINTEQSQSVVFNVNVLNQDLTSFTNYLKRLLKGLQQLKGVDNKRMIYASEDLPVFYHFAMPNLARFKIAYWNKSLLNSLEIQNLKVEEIEISAEWQDLLSQINKEVCTITSTEIWNDDTVKSTLQQIKFYWEAGFFKEKQTALTVIEEFKLTIELIGKQAEFGKRFNFEKNQATSANFDFFSSDLMIGNNTVLIKTEAGNTTYIGYNTFNFLITKNASFNESVNQWLQNIIHKSSLISGVDEKQRHQFFKKIYKQIENLKLFIEQD